MNRRDNAPRVLLADYRPPLFRVTRLQLEIELAAPRTRVVARLHFECDGAQSLQFDAVGLQLQSIAIDGVRLSAHEYVLDDSSLTLIDPPPRGELQTSVEIDVTASAAEGIIQIGDVLVTNCEPEGFRRITFFPDRPDVLCRMSATLIADAHDYPTLLSNGVLVERGSLPGGRHYVRWDDPFPKASYLFALVAGRFARMDDEFTTASGRRVQLSVHARPQDLPYCRYGLAALRKAMAWDERTYGREYDLDSLNLVVMRSYPGGAMECKGLNLYASEFFLASPGISTDEELVRVAGVVGHEYFHNWSGNRVGCRDWFQLSLKEGLTVYRQQQFVAALIGEAGARIDDVIRLRELQYQEDEGGMAHAVRPQAYVTVSNLYTRTVYEKGAELLRMMSLIVGPERFTASIRAFFDEHDGRATTIDDLIDTIERVSGRDLRRFRRWYDTIGRPRLQVRDEYDASARRYTLTVTQSTAPPVSIPVQIGLLDRQGRSQSFRLGESVAPVSECLVEVQEQHQSFVMNDVQLPPVPSLLRRFSAPVEIQHSMDDAVCSILAMHDVDDCSRYEAARRLAVRTLRRIGDVESAEVAGADAWLSVVDHVLSTSHSDLGLAGRLLRLPSLRDLISDCDKFDLDALRMARGLLRRVVVQRFRERLWRLRRQLPATSDDDAFDVRRIRNRCLWYLAAEWDRETSEECWAQLRTASTMEDQFAAFQLLIDTGGSCREQALQEFELRWRHLPAAFDYWFRAQAASETDDCADRVQALLGCADFSFDNATRIKATFDTFTVNLGAFHRSDGGGYAVVEEVVLALRQKNPRLAARFLKRFDGWHRYDSLRRMRLQRVLQRVLAAAQLAPELHEIASESLRAGEGA